MKVKLFEPDTKVKIFGATMVSVILAYVSVLLAMIPIVAIYTPGPWVGVLASFVFFLPMVYHYRSTIQMYGKVKDRWEQRYLRYLVLVPLVIPAAAVLGFFCIIFGVFARIATW